jgi:hypothetical protein
MRQPHGSGSGFWARGMGPERDPGPLLATCLRGRDLSRDRNGVGCQNPRSACKSSFLATRTAFLTPHTVRSKPTRVAFSVLGARLAARPPQDLLALQFELCSPRLSASRANARCGLRAFGPGFWPQGQFDHSTPLIRLPRSLGFRQTSWPDAERKGVELSHGRPHGEDPRVARAGQEVLATHWEIEARSAPFPAESLIE